MGFFRVLEPERLDSSSGSATYQLHDLVQVTWLVSLIFICKMGLTVVLNYCVLFIYLFFIIIIILAALGLRCCAQAFSSCSKGGLLFVVVRGFLITVPSLVAEHGLQVCGLQ